MTITEHPFSFEVRDVLRLICVAVILVIGSQAGAGGDTIYDQECVPWNDQECLDKFYPLKGTPECLAMLEWQDKKSLIMELRHHCVEARSSPGGGFKFDPTYNGPGVCSGYAC